MSVRGSGAHRARRRERPVFGAPLLLGFAFMMGVVVTVVFPTPREFAEAPAKQPADEYSIAYLTVLTRAYPRDAQLRAVHVRQLASLGRWDEALAILAAGPPDPAAAAANRSMRLELVLARARAIPEGLVARAVALEAVHDELRAMLDDPLPPARLRELARLALELEDPGLAARFHLLLAEVERDPAARAGALADAGRWMRASGDGGRASELLRRASESTPDAARRREYLLAAADALEATERPCEAADLLGRASEGEADLALLERATALMTSCGRAREAKLLGRQLVALGPDRSGERALAQVKRELEAGDPAGALALLGPMVRRRPGDAELRERTARVAEWAGQPQIALEHWVWLLTHGRARPRGQR